MYVRPPPQWVSWMGVMPNGFGEADTVEVMEWVFYYRSYGQLTQGVWGLRLRWSQNEFNDPINPIINYIAIVVDSGTDLCVYPCLFLFNTHWWVVVSSCVTNFAYELEGLVWADHYRWYHYTKGCMVVIGDHQVSQLNCRYSILFPE